MSKDISMNTLLEFFLRPSSADTLQLALFFLRVGIGVIMVMHGYPKIIGGVETWHSLGNAMGNFGIHFFPVVWGFLCACTEFFGGLSFIFGIGVRFSCLLLLFAMVVALVMHLKMNDSFDVYSHALTLIVIFIAFFIIGSGTFSLDRYLTQQ